MLDLGFAEELTRILALLPANVRTCCSPPRSPAKYNNLPTRCCNNPCASNYSMHRIATRHQPTRHQVDDKQRTQLLKHLLLTEHWPQVLVFVATQYATEQIAEKLRRNQIN